MPFRPTPAAEVSAETSSEETLSGTPHNTEAEFWWDVTILTLPATTKSTTISFTAIFVALSCTTMGAETRFGTTHCIATDHMELPLRLINHPLKSKTTSSITTPLR